MQRAMTAVCAAALAALLAQAAWAAPSLAVTKPPIVFFNPSWTGPTQDPHAEQGQWFRDVTSGAESPRTHEFHDNVVDPPAGGGVASSAAIVGTVSNVVTDPASGNITAFGILATITNDTPALSPWAMGMNSHMEMQMATSMEEQYEGPLLETKLTASFAVAPGLLPPGATGVYVDIMPHIVAANHDQLAWYCWTPGNDPGYAPEGDFFVPTWDFGDIEPDASASRQMDFTVDGDGLDPNDPRYDVIFGGGDVLLNRSVSLKISDWLSPLTADDGSPYLEPYALSSDVSVFHNVPEPASLALLGVGACLVACRRRRSAPAS